MFVGERQRVVNTGGSGKQYVDDVIGHVESVVYMLRWLGKSFCLLQCLCRRVNLLSFHPSSVLPLIRTRYIGELVWLRNGILFDAFL